MNIPQAPLLSASPFSHPLSPLPYIPLLHPASPDSVQPAPLVIPPYQTILGHKSVASVPFFPRPHGQIPSYPHINPIALLKLHENFVKVKQLQAAFELGIVRRQHNQAQMQSSSHSRSMDKDLHFLGNPLSVAEKEQQEANNSSKLQAQVISQWDPWFHRRIKKTTKKEAKAPRKPANKSRNLGVNKGIKKRIVTKLP